jgi:WD40 repeat protein
MKKTIPFVLALTLFAGVTCAADTPDPPVLRLETGMHTALVRSIAADQAGRFVVSASDDKTVRVWEREGTGFGSDPVRVLRPPLGPGHEGKLNAVAITPDGASVACGGWTGWGRDGKSSVYLFERASGLLKKRLSGFPEVVKGLAYSRDGAYLAVTLGGKGGLYVLRCADWQPVLVDRAYGGDAYGVVFAADGRLATSSWDGFLRLYGKNLKIAARKPLQSGSRPFGVSFSPDGKTLAVGSVEAARVELLSAQDLTFLRALPVDGIRDGALSCVAWGAGGDLYAAGSCRAKGSYFIRRWGGVGLGVATDLGVASGDILALAALADGGLAYAGAAPEVGIIAGNGAVLLRRLGDSADFRDTQPDFRVSRDGASIQFGLGPAGAERASFSVSDRHFAGAAGSSAGLTLPQIYGEGMLVENWLNGSAPTLNGVPLPLERFETSRSLALLPDGKGVVLGTDWNLRCYGRDGKSRWQVSAPGISWGVNATGDGRFVVAAFGDGTVRWFQASDGKELLALFTHRDRKRWLLWTPAGYYDASPGAEDLAGWHLNNGPDQAADFFPVSRFRQIFCRPDLIARILPSGGEVEAPRLADAAAGRGGELRPLSALLPPVVAIRAPLDRSAVQGKEVLVSFEVRIPSGEPVTGVRVLVNGRPVQFGEQDKTAQPGSPRSVTVPLPPGESEISVIAENRYAASVPATVRVSRGADEPVEEISILPRLFILSAGVSAYPDKELQLEFAAKDARDFASFMLSQKGGLYGDVTVKTLTDAAATREAIIEGLAWLRREATARDTAVVFISGHGISDPNGSYYFLPVNGDPEKLAGSAVVFSEIRNTLMALPGKAVLFVDTCHAGDVMGGSKAAAVVDRVVNELSSTENGVVVFASSTGQQSSIEDDSWGNGAFTKALVEGLSGKADYTGKGKITVTSLDLWLSERVKELTEGKQTPTTAKPRTIPDFPLALRR